MTLEAKAPLPCGWCHELPEVCGATHQGFGPGGFWRCRNYCIGSDTARHLDDWNPRQEWILAHRRADFEAARTVEDGWRTVYETFEDYIQSGAA